MEKLNGNKFKAMLVSGANNLSNHHREIDALNVFPVPDGDTGTNMNLTFSSGVKEAQAHPSTHIGEIAKTLSKGLLMGARGNSGVILSQIFRGFYQSVEGKNDLDAKDIALAFVRGTEVAYKAVMRPVEGTILTVLRESAHDTLAFVEEQHSKNIIAVLDFMIKRAKISLENTPNLLPVLKEVGVVFSELSGIPIELVEDTGEIAGVQSQLENDEFGYCTELIIKLNAEVIPDFSENHLREQLSDLGNSIVVVQDEEIVKIHVHTLSPGDVLNLGQAYGELLKIKSDNMQLQHEHAATFVAEPQQKKKYALIAVASGEGLTRLFKDDYRVDLVISGGQTMNPATEDFVEAIKSLNAEHIFILPNNSNIILAAQQAESLMDEVDVHVIPTKSIPQGLSACVMFNPQVDVQENLSEMTEAFKHVKTGLVTYAIKDSTIDGMNINENDYMGIHDKTIVVSVPSRMQAVQALLENLVTAEDGLITLIVGEDVDEDEQADLETYITEHFDACEVDVHKGHQPVYSYIIGVE
ncbi:MAG: DAK2 domain-containing protein YloV [Erysipelotrichaceae bacterium]|nr:MAG: DAK2 domain-containing protein YloV [Erysipelotrichaceae bacterium]